ncbi:MAG: DUF433 domain-containing protein [Gemmatimonadota bacterium]
MTITFDDRITIDPGVRLGKPVIRGTRIPAELITIGSSGLESLPSDAPEAGRR